MIEDYSLEVKEADLAVSGVQYKWFTLWAKYTLFPATEKRTVVSCMVQSPLSLSLSPVSYTHLTLPTTASV